MQVTWQTRILRSRLHILVHAVGILLTISTLANAQDSKPKDAINVLREITVRIVAYPKEGIRISTGFFIHPEGLILTSDYAVESEDSGKVVLETS